jgi:hypothetical protein
MALQSHTLGAHFTEEHYVKNNYSQCVRLSGSADIAALLLPHQKDKGTRELPKDRRGPA